MVGVRGFEPPAPSSRTRCATRLRYTPPRRRTSSPAILRFASSYSGAWACQQARCRKSVPLWPLKRHPFGTSRRDRLAPTDFEPNPCLGTGPMRHTPALRKIKNHSGEGCGSSVVEHSLGKGEAESSILSRSTSLRQPAGEPAVVLAGPRRLRRWPSASLDPGCARRRQCVNRPDR